LRERATNHQIRPPMAPSTTTTQQTQANIRPNV
jgi:hypothetical protein